MVSTTRIPWGRLAPQALAAGIAGAVLFDGYLWLTTIAPEHGSLPAYWRSVAAAALGKGALADPASAWIGLVVVLLVSIAWAAGYAYLAARRPVLTQRWPIAGLVFGAIVYAIMQCILLAGNNFTFPPTPNAFLNAIAAHTIFFGLPVAYVVAVLQPRTVRR